jgi:hypothetical protein
MRVAMAPPAPSPDRSTWPVRVYRLGSEPSDDLSAGTTATERLAMMWPLALEAWDLTGRPLPQYARSETAVRIRPFPSPLEPAP